MKYKFTPENVTIYNSHLIRNEKEIEPWQRRLAYWLLARFYRP